ncbi:dihydrolipoyl dehydrogenase [candidate division KSB1 bacterium]|nr:dihydrolipoyl dehydrogenase [candidate division KSB1 bacterium]
MSEPSKKLVVLGAGPGGYAAAFLAADMGMDVTVIDPEVNPGGVCLYRGCIPSKALLHVAKLLSETEEAKNWGIEYQKPKIDIDKLRTWKTSVVDRLTGGLGQLTRQRKINHIRGIARFLDNKTLEITDLDGKKNKVAFENVIIATGSRPVEIPALKLESPKVIDSTGALELNDVPERLLVIGGGYIGLEMGTVYSALGSKVTVVEMTPGLLPGADRDLVRVLEKGLTAKFESILLNTKVVEMKEVKEGIRVRFEGGQPDDKEQIFDKVLMTVGRKPNSENLGLENTNVKINERGFIRVDGQRRTDEPNIFAIGDVAGEPMLAHKASHEGHTAVEAIAGHKSVFEPRAIPAVVFTDPEIAWCGLTETQAREQNRNVQVLRFPWAASGRAMTMDRIDGLTKLLIDPDSERILGMGIAGAGAGELIAEGVVAIEMAANATDLKMSIHPHPTLSETIMETAEMFFGTSTHIYRPKRK